MQNYKFQFPTLNRECLVCESTHLSEGLHTQNLHTLICNSCGHTIAAHKPSILPDDYHDQHPGEVFLEILRVTRERQAHNILEQIRTFAPNSNRLLDYGCGRGWFLQVAHKLGFDVVGVDTSQLSVQLLRQMGLRSELLNSEDGLDPSHLPFKPEVVSFLDVVEHFPPHEVVTRLKDISVSFAPVLQLIAIKVPVSNGLMYRAAMSLNRIGKSDFIDRLYQVGTEPPHLSYYSIRSLRLTINKAGYKVVGILKDCDFEPDSLFTRAQTSIKIPTLISHLCGQIAVSFANWFNLQDSVVLFAKPQMIIT